MLLACWEILCQLAPWLLLGMLLSGLLHVLLPEGFIRHQFHGWKGVCKAVLLGVPLPLCSCGVIPAGIGIKNQGASDGAAVGFMISTPQTGIDSILVSASFFGWPFAIFKMFAAAATGVIGGVVAEQVQETELQRAPVTQELNLEEQGVGRKPGWLSVWTHGMEIVRSIWIWLLIGIVLSAAIEVYVPQEWFAAVTGLGLLPAMLIVLLVSIPIYVCATASVPIAAALVGGGFPPAVALVFLMAGPATNVTTIGAIFSRFGWRTLLVYIATIVGGSMAFAWMFDWVLTANVTDQAGYEHDHNNWWSVASGLILLAMIAWFIGSDISRWLSRRNQIVDVSTEYEFGVEGMTCGGCVGRLESELKKSDGIKSVFVQLHPGRVQISGNVDRRVIQKLVQDLGFRVTDVRGN